MIERLASAPNATATARFALHYRWTPWDQVSKQLPIALVAAEDQKFPFHHGFDFDAIQNALADADDGERLRGASTISQQVAKNLFLWNGRSFVRKGLEAYFTVLIEALWPKRRILEVYLNIAEFGDGIYGARRRQRALLPHCAGATRRAPGRAARRGVAQSSALARRAPFRLRAAARRLDPAQANQLGGPAYLPR